MIRKIGVIFLSIVICTVTVASALTMEYKEAPMLRTKVAGGELPPVEERLPEEPLVVKPLEEIGQYGGTWRMDAPMGTTGIYAYLLREGLAHYSLDFKEMLPNIAKGWQAGKDGKSITFFLRKGMKWSDGAPFTADDFMFWYEDIALNKELTPTPPVFLKFAGEIVVMEKVDDYTIRFSFVKPYSIFLAQLCSPFTLVYAPKHYLKQFHPKYTSMDKIKKEMKKESFDRWTDLFLAKNTTFDNPDLPTIDPWIPINTVNKPMHLFVRNPYYWKVDIEGNQLPYIDRIQRTSSDSEGLTLKIIAGEIDYQWYRCGGLTQYSLYMQNREKGNYRLIPFTNVGTNQFTIFFNFYDEDLFLRKLFRNKRFRIALSIAINRMEMSELLFKGIYIPAQPGPAPGSPWYEERFCNYYIEYDPKRANEILDEIGLKWDKNHEYRLRPDGKRLRFVMSTFTPWESSVEAMELVKRYWKKIGIEMVNKPVDMKLWVTRMNAGKYDVSCYSANMGAPTIPPVKRTEVFPIGGGSWWAPQWRIWFDTNGKSGEEPPAEVKHLIEIRDKILSESSLEKRIELSKEALAIHAENMWMIGTLRPPQRAIYVIAKNNVGNVPKIHPIGTATHVSVQLFFKK